MAKLHIITLNQDTEFSGIKLTAGTVLGSFDSEVGIDPTQAFNMLQYRQASVDVIEYDPKDQDELLPTNVPSDDDDDSDDVIKASDATEPNVAVAVSDQVAVDKVDNTPQSDLYSIPLSESTVEALIAAGIPDLKALTDYIASGKDLVDLPKIGPVKVKNILDALKSSGISDSLAAADDVIKASDEAEATQESVA